jgi:uncharacterized protein YycO
MKMLARTLVATLATAAVIALNPITPNAATAGGGTADTALPEALSYGDVFNSYASTAGYAHGHTGIYYTTYKIVHAPGLGQISLEQKVTDVRVAKPIYLMHITSTTATQRATAAQYADNYLRGYKYNTNFLDNKKLGTSLNCSQLVWLAWKQAKVDLDANGGASVMPADIKNSTRTSIYKTIS